LAGRRTAVTNGLRFQLGQGSIECGGRSLAIQRDRSRVGTHGAPDHYHPEPDRAHRL